MAISKSDINALYNQALGRDAKKSELDYWSTKTQKGSLINALIKTPGVSQQFLQTYPGAAQGAGIQPSAPSAQQPAGALPEQPILDATKLTSEQDVELQKRAYWDYVRRYGVEVPELSSKFGLPPDYKADDTLYGLDLQQYAAQRAMTQQNLASAMESFDLERNQIVKEWTALKQAIENGTIDPTSETAVAYQRNLEQKTLALQQTRQSLSARGTLYGGVAQRQTQLAAQPYEQQAADIQRQTQSSYDQAMAEYLGKKKGAEIQYGLDQPGGAVEGSYGGGTFDKTTGQFTGVKYGLTPQQAAQQGLTFFGTDPYNILIQQQQRQRQLEEELRTGQASRYQQLRQFATTEGFQASLNY